MVPMTARLVSMVTYVEGLLPTKPHMTLLSRGLVKSLSKLKALYLHYFSVYGHQTWQDGDLP